MIEFTDEELEQLAAMVLDDDFDYQGDRDGAAAAASVVEKVTTEVKRRGLDHVL